MPGSVTSRLYRSAGTPDRPLGQPALRPGDPHAARDLGGPALEPGHLEDPVDGRGRRRMGAVRRSASPGRPGGPGPAARRPGRPRRSGRGGRPPSRAGRRRRPAAGPGGPARGPRPARRCPQHSGQQLGPDPVAQEARVVVGRVAHRLEAQVGAQGRPSRPGAGPRIGWVGPARMPASPWTPAPRSRLASTVSAWSSAVWPVAAPAPSTPVAGGAGPGLEVGAVGHHHPFGPEAGAEARRRPRPPPRPRRPSPGAARGRRGRRSPGTRPPWPAPAGRGSRGHPTPRTTSGSPAGGNVQRREEVGHHRVGRPAPGPVGHRLTPPGLRSAGPVPG